MAASAINTPSLAQLNKSEARTLPSGAQSSLPPNKRDNTTPSCAVCQRRKTGLECSFRPINYHRTKRRKSSHVKEDEGETSQTGPAPATSPARSASVRQHEALSPIPDATTAHLVKCGGGYRYVNNHLWNTLPAHESHLPSPGAASTTLTSTPSAQHTPTDGSQTHRSAESGYESVTKHPSVEPSDHFVFRQQQTVSDSLQLSPGHIVQLWHVYLERVDPMMKAFHSPSVQQMVLGQINRPNILPNEYALVSAVYLISVVSLTDSECLSILQETRQDALDRFRKATETALSAAGFVTTADFTVLQALVLYLAALRSLGDPATVWSLLGITIRVAGTQGLARDGSFLGLPPFEAELRRRLWWAIVYMDSRTAELVGQDGDLLVQKHDVKPPSNLNDSDLFPSMRRIPDSRGASTEMLYVQFRATHASIMRTLPNGFGAGGTFKRLESLSVPLPEKLDNINMVEQRLNEEILRDCDPGIPLQLFTMNAVATLLTKMRLIAHIPLTYIDGTSSANGKYSADVFQLSVSLIQLQLDLWNESCLQRWHWHWRSHFQWFALACLIRQSRLRPPGEQTTEAWATIRAVFDTILPSQNLSAKKSPLIVGIQSLLNAGTTTQPPADKREDKREVQYAVSTPESHSYTYSGDKPEAPTMIASSSSAKISTSQNDTDNTAPRPQIAAHDLTTTDAVTDAEPEFDFDAVDWVEFDRLTAELSKGWAKS
nr:aurofusarin cluster transcription factor aurR2-like [Quercus suber]POE50743.1 bikaverin cluster transcription factor bik5 [Quercus suber]